MRNKRNPEFNFVLKNGYVPGMDLLFLKMIIKLGIAIYMGYVIIQFIDVINEQPIVVAYKEIAEQHAKEIREALRESQYNLQLPPLEVLTNILNMAKELSLDEKVSYMIEHKRALLQLLKIDQTLTAADVTNLYEIIKYISKEANEANELSLKQVTQNIIQNITDKNIINNKK
jgi:hypothetical protein